MRIKRTTLGEFDRIESSRGSLEVGPVSLVVVGFRQDLRAEAEAFRVVSKAAESSCSPGSLRIPTDFSCPLRGPAQRSVMRNLSKHRAAIHETSEGLASVNPSSDLLTAGSDDPACARTLICGARATHKT